MASSGGFAPISNSSAAMESYVFHSTIRMIQMITDKIVFGVYVIVLLVSVVQAFWKNKHIDRLLASMNSTYSDGKFQSNQIYFREQILTCYRFDQRFSHIPNPKRSILFIISTHIQVLLLIAIQTLFARRQSEPINDCLIFHYPYEILECENEIDPCQFNYTEIAPKCTYYHFELRNIITMVTSIISWHYALRYLIVKLIRLVRWALFRDNDQPRRLCCCCRVSPCALRCLMYLQYIYLWLYFSIKILSGFLWNISVFSLSISLLGPTWTPFLMAGDWLCTLVLALIPELIQNWLDATSNGKILHDFESKGLLLAKAEPLIYLTNN